MQSDGNRFCGDVVLDSFNMVYSDEESVKKKNMKSKSVGIFILRVIEEYAYVKNNRK